MTIDEIIKRTSHIPSTVYESEQAMWLRIISNLEGNPVIVDFGTGWGKSASSMGLCNSKATVYTFDVGTEHINDARSKDDYIDEVGAYIKKSGAVNVRFDMTSSLEVSWDKEIDVLNIDSNHLYEHAKKEINRWLPLVKVRGIVFLHDWEHEKFPGVRAAWDELVPSKFNFKLIDKTKFMKTRCGAFRKLS